MKKIHGYDPLTYWALAALARLNDANTDRELALRFDAILEDPDFADVVKAVEAFEALHLAGSSDSRTDTPLTRERRPV